MSRIIIMLAGFICIFFSPICFSAEVAIESPIVDSKLLGHAELEMVWQNNLSFKQDEQVDRLFLLGDYIVVLTDLNYLFCLDNADGKLRFGLQVTTPGFPVFEPKLHDEELMVVAGNELIRIDIKLGTIIKTKRLKFNATGSAVKDSYNVFIPGQDRRLHALDLADDIEIFNVTARNDSMVTSVVSSRNYVVFATDMGNIIGITPDGSERLWQFDAVKEISADLVKNGSWLYASSKDTNLYKIYAATGKVEWRFEAGGMLLDSAVVTEKRVYQYIRDRGVAAVDKESGERIWQLEGGVGVLAEAGAKTYVKTSDGKLAVMDNIKGKELYRINLASAEKFAANAVDSKMYIADKAGRVGCIQPKR